MSAPTAERAPVPLGTILLVVTGLVASCGEEPVTSRFEGPSFLGADGVVMDGEYWFTTAEGIRSSYLTFDTAYTYNDSADTELRGVDLTIHNDDGSERARVTSREGTAGPRFESLIARGMVVAVIPSEGRRLETDHLEYEPEEDRISGNTCFVLYEEGEEPQRGTSITSDLEFRNFTLVNDPVIARERGCP